MTPGEQYYDEHIAPKLLALCNEAKALGFLGFVALVEWEYGETGRTAFVLEKSSLVCKMTNIAAQCGANVDKFWFWVQRYAREHGHSSIFLHEQGIPHQPVVKPDAEELAMRSAGL